MSVGNNKVLGMRRGKAKYDKKTATSFVNQHPFGYNGKKLRIYQCQICQFWHLTKKQ